MRNPPPLARDAPSPTTTTSTLTWQTCVGLHCADISVNPTMSENKIVTASYSCPRTRRPSFKSSTTLRGSIEKRSSSLRSCSSASSVESSSRRTMSFVCATWLSERKRRSRAASCSVKSVILMCPSTIMSRLDTTAEQRNMQIRFCSTADGLEVCVCVSRRSVAVQGSFTRCRGSVAPCWNTWARRNALPRAIPTAIPPTLGRWTWP